MKIVIVLIAIFGISFSLGAKEVPYPTNKLPGDAHGASCTCVVCPGIKRHNDGQASAGGRNTSTGQCTLHPSQPATACSECKKLKEIEGTKQAHSGGQASAGGKNTSTGQCTLHPSQPATACSECKKLKEVEGTKQANQKRKAKGDDEPFCKECGSNHPAGSHTFTGDAKVKLPKTKTAEASDVKSAESASGNVKEPKVKSTDSKAEPSEKKPVK